MKKIVLLALALLLALPLALRAVPTINPRITVILSNGDQVTLYGDTEDANLLYFMPSRLVVKRENGRAQLHAVVFRGITSLSADQMLRNMQVGRLGGGVLDCLLELQGPTKNLDELRQVVAKQYPRYAQCRITQIPLIPGSASVSIVHDALDRYAPPQLSTLTPSQQEQLTAMTSGGPVSSELGGAVVARFKLSELDAQILLETIGKSDFTSAFNVLFSAQTRLNLPPTTVEVIANEHRAYSYVESHFKSSGGFWIFNYAADLRKIRQKLVESGNLEIKIDRQHDEFSAEFLNGIADRWIEEFIFKRMHRLELDLPKERAEAQKTGKSKFWEWTHVGASYSRVDISQFIDKKFSVKWTFQGAENFPVYAKAEFTGLRQATITAVDMNQSFFSYTPIAVIPPESEALQSGLLESIRVSINARTSDGATRGFGTTFNRIQTEPYFTMIPATLKLEHEAGGSVRSQLLSELRYSVEFASKTGRFSLENLTFPPNTDAFSCPSISVTQHVGILTVEIGEADQVFSDFPKLVRLDLVIAAAAGPPIRLTLNRSHPRMQFFYDPRQPPPGLSLEARYRTPSGYVTRSGPLDNQQLLDRLLLDESLIPDLLTYGQ